LLQVKIELLTVYCSWATHTPDLQRYATLRHDVREKTFKRCTLLSNINSSLDRRKMTDVGTVVMKEKQRLSSRS
jgi:hypothetical protein